MAAPALGQSEAVRACGGEAKPAGIVRLAREVGAIGEFVLGDGSRVRLAGLAFLRTGAGEAISGTNGSDQPGATPTAPGGANRPIAGAAELDALDARLQAGDALVLRTGTALDRWGRAPVQLVLDDRLVAEELLAAGWAVMRPGELSSACRRVLLKVEAAARRDRRGVWATPDAVVAAEDTVRLKLRGGRLSIIEGRVRSLGETNVRHYLNFGAIRSENFSISIAKGSLRSFEASGMRWSSLVGRHIRVRGVVLDRGAPAVEITGPDEIERLD